MVLKLANFGIARCDPENSYFLKPLRFDVPVSSNEPENEGR